MKYNQKTHPLLLGILYGIVIYGLVVLTMVYRISDDKATVLIILFILFEAILYLSFL